MAVLVQLETSAKQSLLDLRQVVTSNALEVL